MNVQIWIFLICTLIKEKGEKQMIKKKLVKSDVTDQFEIDEELVNEISDSDEFKDVEITTEDVMDAVQAIDALADAVIDKADAEQKEVDADMLLEEVSDMIDNVHEDEVELEEEEILPEELTNAAVRVMVSEDGAVELEQKPDEVYDSEIDGLGCTVFDTVDIPGMEIEDVGDTTNTEDDLLVIGNSKSKSYKKGYVKLASSVSKKAWSAAYKTVKKLVKSEKLTAAHWAIVSALATKIEEENNMKRKLQSAVFEKIRSNANIRAKLLKSDFSEVVEGQDTQEDVDDAGQPVTDTKPEMTAGEGNPGYEEEKKPTEEKSPEIVDSQSGNPVEDPDKQNEREDDVIVEEETVSVMAPLTNSKRKITFKKVVSNHGRMYSAYKAVGVDSNVARALDGKVVKSGKNAYIFKDTANGLLACVAKFVDNGKKGTYTTVLENNRIVISKGEKYPVFNHVEKFINTMNVHNARIASSKTNKVEKKPVNNSKQEAVQNRRRMLDASRKMQQRKDELIRSHMAERRAQMNERKAIQSRIELQKMHDAEERERLFQSSQSAINEEKILIKQGMNRNSEALNRMYDNMF